MDKFKKILFIIYAFFRHLFNKFVNNNYIRLIGRFLWSILMVYTKIIDWVHPNIILRSGEFSNLAMNSFNNACLKLWDLFCEILLELYSIFFEVFPFLWKEFRKYKDEAFDENIRKVNTQLYERYDKWLPTNEQKYTWVSNAYCLPRVIFNTITVQLFIMIILLCQCLFWYYVLMTVNCYTNNEADNVRVILSIFYVLSPNWIGFFLISIWAFLITLVFFIYRRSVTLDYINDSRIQKLYYVVLFSVILSIVIYIYYGSIFINVKEHFIGTVYTFIIETLKSLPETKYGKAFFDFVPHSLNYFNEISQSIIRKLEKQIPNSYLEPIPIVFDAVFGKCYMWFTPIGAKSSQLLFAECMIHGHNYYYDTNFSYPPEMLLDLVVDPDPEVMFSNAEKLIEFTEFHEDSMARTIKLARDIYRLKKFAFSYVLGVIIFTLFNIGG